MNRITLLLSAIVLALSIIHSVPAGAQCVSFGEEIGQLSFEKTEAPARPGKGGKVSISGEHAKFGSKSLLWEWKKGASELYLDVNVPYLHRNPNPKETSVSTFVFWIYSPEQLQGTLEFSFMKDGKKCCGFTYNLGFTGWRGSWVAFDRDMDGDAVENMDRIVITAPASVKKGRLFIDAVIPASFQDVRHHSPDWQTPFVNKDTEIHWMVLNKNWNKKLDIPLKDSITAKDVKTMALVEERFEELVSAGSSAPDLDEVRKIYESYRISCNPDGSIQGKPVFFTRYGETFINLGIKDASKQFARNGQLLVTFNDNMLKIAKAWRNASDPEVRREIADIYVSLTRHILDQGFAAGSGLGTVHHLGYSMRNFYTAPVLMKEVLVEAGLDRQVQQAMEWFSGVGEVKEAPAEPGIDIDAFNTSLMGRMAAVLMMEDTPYKYAYLQAVSRWIDNGFKYTGGTKACFKTDGSVCHHRKAYPAYATGGFDGAVKAVWMLNGTSLAVSEESHRILKEALLAMRFYCNKESFPLAMSGRHPDGLGALLPYQYALLADSGTPDGRSGTDPELAAAYLRLSGTAGSFGKKFYKEGFRPEPTPEGNRVFSYNCSMSHRADDWLVTFAGHSRYLWAAEIYNHCNHYGRYLSHGSMQILTEAGSFGSGFKQQGWDWCHIPGTTAAEIPMEKMKATILNVDEFSGYEEMLLSDEWFAGGVSHLGKDGAYAMVLHEHDKYNGSLRAHKSYFAFGNRIIALGSDLENRLPDSELHTTLFQNTVDESMPTTVDGQSYTSLDWHLTRKGDSVLEDRLGNVYYLKDAEVCVSRKLQHSYHEETDAPTQALFEKAYINHGTLCGKDIEGCDDSYEYMVAVLPDDAQKETYSEKLPYEVLRCDRTAHIVRDFPTGTVACAAFEETEVDGLVSKVTPAMLMYTLYAGADDACARNEMLVLSVANPDLALYVGPSDEIFDGNGKRKERSVYSRGWVNNSCGETSVDVVLEGEWQVGNAGKSDVVARIADGKTFLHFRTAESRTEEINLVRNK